jgi:hypothetical protein
MAAELTQVPDRAARWRFAVGCARAAVFPPGGNRTAVGAAGAAAVVAIAAVALATGAALPAGRVFALAFVGLLAGLATLAAARSRPTSGTGGTGRRRLGPVAAALALVGVVACLAATTYYLAEHPSYRQLRLPAMAASLPPVTAVVLAAVLAGCLWLALRPPRWLVPDRHGRRFAIAMALVLVAGFVLASRQELRSAELDVGVLDYLFLALPVVLLVGSAAAATVGRSFRAGLWACAWAVVLTLPLLVAAWLAEALRWHQQRGQLLLDGEGGLGLGANLVGANLGDAIWWSLVALVLWALPLGVIGAAAGGAGARRRRLAG